MRRQICIFASATSFWTFPRRPPPYLVLIELCVLDRMSQTRLRGSLGSADAATDMYFCLRHVFLDIPPSSTTLPCSDRAVRSACQSESRSRLVDPILRQTRGDPVVLDACANPPDAIQARLRLNPSA